MSKKQKTKIYYSPYCFPDQINEMNLVLNEPVPFFKTLPNLANNVDQSNNYYACRAAQVSQKNMYVINHHRTSTAELSGSIYKPALKSDDVLWSARGATYDNSYSVDYNLSWIFFSEDDVNLRLTAPYMHQNTAVLSGSLASGSFYINKWFRPINISYQLWQGVNSITITENEPAAYIEFDIDNDIELIPFTLTKEIFDVAVGCLNTKKHLSNQPLQNLYDRFTRKKVSDKLMPLIKQQIVGHK
jgi:hypothetical protein